MILEFPNNFNGFNLNSELLKFNKRNNIIDLFVKYKLLNEFPESLFNLISLQSLIFYSDDSLYFPHKFDRLNNLIYIITTAKKIDVVESLD